MKTCFADTYFFLALLSEDDEAHDQALALNQSVRAPLVTTGWVLTEVADALCRPAVEAALSRVVGRTRERSSGHDCLAQRVPV